MKLVGWIAFDNQGNFLCFRDKEILGDMCEEEMPWQYDSKLPIVITVPDVATAIISKKKV